MHLRVGCRIGYRLQQPTPMIALLNVHHSRAGDLTSPDRLRTTPSVPLESYRDGFGNWCVRFVAPAGAFEIGMDGIVADSGETPAPCPDAVQHPVEELPSDTIGFLLGSRYCDTDVLSDRAWSLFETTEPGWARVQAICDYVHETITFDYLQARSTRTASQTLEERVGVCRDFTHLAVAFCRCMNIPTRYCTGYISDIGTPPPYPANDFAAWMEVYLGGAWHVFDPRNNAPRIGRILVARGRDAADVPLTHSFGSSYLTDFQVWADEVAGGDDTTPVLPAAIQIGR